MDVRIPSFHTTKSSGKEVTVFVFEVYVGQRSYVIEKRYSDILRLHKQLKKQITTPQFPPKQIRNRDKKVLEHRRQGLDAYFENISINGSYPEALFNFFGIKNIPTNLQSNIVKTESMQSVNLSSTDELSTADIDEINSLSKQRCHCDVIMFTGDPFFPPKSYERQIPSTAVVGVLRALYNEFDCTY